MLLDTSDQEMIIDITRMGVRAAVLLRGVILREVGVETLEWGLQELNSYDLLGTYFERLLERPEYVHLLNLLYLIWSLEGQLDFQCREYGLDSVKDDLQEINFSLQRIGEQFDLEKLQQTVQ